MLNLLSLLKNKLVLSLGIALVISVLVGTVLYFKSKADEADGLKEENKKLSETIKEKDDRAKKIMEALSEVNQKAASRETLINNKKQKLIVDAHANDNLSPDYDIFFNDLWLLEQAANDN